MTIIVSTNSTVGELTILQIIQKVCARIGVPVPSSAVGSSDPQIQQMVALAEAEGQDQATRFPWTSLQNQFGFTTVAATTQITLPTDFDYILNDTIWNRDLRRPIYGGTSAKKWQQDNAMRLNSPFPSYRIKGNQLLMFPVPVAGQTCTFEYISHNWVISSVGVSQYIWVQDTDTVVIDAQLIILGTIWRWKQAKGLDYAEDFNTYEKRINDSIARDGGKPHLDLNGGIETIHPAFYIQAGSFTK